MYEYVRAFIQGIYMSLEACLVCFCVYDLNSFFISTSAGTQSRYTVLEQPGGVSILRIEPVRAGRDDAPYECVAENGVGDAVSADATLTVYEGKCLSVNFLPNICHSKCVYVRLVYTHIADMNERYNQESTPSLLFHICSPQLSWSLRTSFIFN